jgi:hypothetical protein
MRLRLRGVAVGLVVLGAVAACSGGDGTEAPDVAARAAHLEAILSGAAPDRDADQFELDLAARKEKLIAACMAEHNLSYRPRDPRSLADVVTNTDFASRDYAAEYGFGISAFPTFTGAANPLDSLSDKQRAQYQQCAEAANNQAQDEYGVKQANEQFARRDDAVRVDARYQAAEAAWAKCAAAKGYQQPTREALLDSLRADHDKIMQRISTRAERAGVAAQDQDRVVREMALADKEYQDFTAKERTAALDTFLCSQDFDRAYLDVYRSHMS